jgi:hypothetical protein
VYSECDIRKCPAEAIVIVKKDDLRLGLCGHDFDDRMLALFGQGWSVYSDNRPRLRLLERQR